MAGQVPTNPHLPQIMVKRALVKQHLHQTTGMARKKTVKARLTQITGNQVLINPLTCQMAARAMKQMARTRQLQPKDQAHSLEGRTKLHPNLKIHSM
jgi:pyruvate/oxaloacetate carboxyltransferase